MLKFTLIFIVSFTSLSLSHSTSHRTEPDDFVVDRVTATSIIAALKRTKRRNGYPAYSYVYYNLNEKGDQDCQISGHNQTHDTCTINDLQPATSYVVRFRACYYYNYFRSHCTAYSRSQTVLTIPLSKYFVFWNFSKNGK